MNALEVEASIKKITVTAFTSSEFTTPGTIENSIKMLPKPQSLRHGSNNQYSPEVCAKNHNTTDDTNFQWLSAARLFLREMKTCSIHYITVYKSSKDHSQLSWHTQTSRQGSTYWKDIPSAKEPYHRLRSWIIALRKIWTLPLLYILLDLYFYEIRQSTLLYSRYFYEIRLSFLHS